MLRRLEYLLAVEREGHFGRAATSCHVSQPALSAGIAKLEGELGLELVRRGGRTALLTDEGRALLPWAREAVSAASSLTIEAGRLREHLTGTLRIATIPTAAAAVSTMIGALLRAHDGVRVELRSMAAERIVDGLRARELDAGLAYVEDPVAGLRVQRLYRERLMLVGRGPATADDVPWSALAHEPLCLLTPEMQHRRVVDAALAQAGVTVRPRVEADTFGALLDLVADGWSTVLGRPWLSGRPLPDGVRAVPLVRPVVAPWVGLLTLDGPVATPMVAALRASLRGVDVAARLGGAEADAPAAGPA
ncbi:LysR substrate-binding domain-containing protein [Patulibacter sp. NPDC049589]|uniref:LysR family transcriptional regulator n=1 Tax=Patulibacter sp. NPDC049589 TaxID=3154731 RepID=UPI0034178361